MFPCMSYSQISLHCLLVVRALAWAGARRHCQQLGTDLAEMNTRGEQSEVTRYLNNYREFLDMAQQLYTL